MAIAAEYVCAGCGYRSIQWQGRCPQCEEWESFSARNRSSAQVAEAPPLQLIEATGMTSRPTGLPEVDRVLGGGLVPGSVTLLAGAPGAGKSTLTLQIAAGLEKVAKTLIVCAEESADQVAARAARIAGPKTASATASNDAEAISLSLPVGGVAIVDSIQLLRMPNATGEVGGVTQVRASATALTAAARATGCALILVSHVTKDGSVAGPHAVEHLVDTVLMLEGDRSNTLRTLRGRKNRYGPTDEVGMFEMTAKGLIEIPDASSLFMSDRRQTVPGSVVGCVLQGRRPLAAEIQALVADAGGGPVRRVAQGFDAARLSLIIAVLQSRARIQRLRSCDVYASIAGGLRADDVGADLPLALAIAGAATGGVLPSGVAAIGEIGLSGEVRQVPSAASRLKELIRHGFSKVIVPSGVEPAEGAQLIPVKHLGQAIGQILDLDAENKDAKI